MGKHRKKTPKSPSQLEKAEGFTGYLMTLKTRPGLQDLTGIRQKMDPDNTEESRDERHSERQK